MTKSAHPRRNTDTAPAGDARALPVSAALAGSLQDDVIPRLYDRHVGVRAPVGSAALAAPMLDTSSSLMARLGFSALGGDPDAAGPALGTAPPFGVRSKPSRPLNPRGHPASGRGASASEPATRGRRSAGGRATRDKAHHGALAPDMPAIEMLRAAIAAPGDEWRCVLARLADARPRTVIRDAVLVPLAHRLGEEWCSDGASMVDVTIGLARLTEALSLLPGGAGNPSSGTARRVLLVPAAGDTHRFGLDILAETLREEGWACTVCPAGEPALLRRTLRTVRPEIVGVGLAVPRMAPGALEVARIAAALPCPPTLIAGGMGAVEARETLLSGGFDAVMEAGMAPADWMRGTLGAPDAPPPAARAGTHRAPSAARARHSHAAFASDGATHGTNGAAAPGT